MIVCHCNAVSHHQVDATVLAGARDIADVTRACGAGGDCRSCHEVIEDRIELKTGAVRLQAAS